MPDNPLRFLTASLVREGEKDRLSVAAYLMLALLALASFTPGLASLPPTDRDESWYAQASKQMVESSNYIDIRVQEKPRYKKPVGIYWLQVASVKLLSPHKLDAIWAYRIPSLICAVIAVLLTARLGAYLFTPLTGFAAAIMMASSIALNIEARLAKTDAAQLACVLAAQLALAQTWIDKDTPAANQLKSSLKRWLNALLFWFALGAGILIKGPIIVMIVGLTVLGLSISSPRGKKSLKWLQTLYPLPGILLMATIIAPWFIAIALQSHGAFFEQSASHDFFAKLWQGQDRGFMPPGLHLAAFPLMFFPCALFTILAVPQIWRYRNDPRLRFCLSWILPSWIIFEVSLTKLPHYLLPVYPAVAILSAAAIAGALNPQHEQNSATPAKTQTVLFALATGLWLTLGAGLALLSIWIPFAMNGSFNLWQGLAGGLLILAQSMSLMLYLRNRQLASLASLTVGHLVFLTTLIAITVPSLQHIWLSRDIVGSAQKTKPCSSLQIISATYNEPSLVFLAGTTTKITPEGLLAAEWLKQDPCAQALIDQDHLTAFKERFVPPAPQPILNATFEGRNPANGTRKHLSLYALPNATTAK